MRNVILGLVFMLALPAGALAKGLDADQVVHLEYAAAVAAPYDLAQTAAAVELQESSGCKLRHGIDPYSFGCMQVIVSTARIYDPAETEALLMSDDWRNIRVGVAHLVACKARYLTWEKMIRCYHGTNSPNNDDYVAAIRKRMKQVPLFIYRNAPRTH